MPRVLRRKQFVLNPHTKILQSTGCYSPQRDDFDVIAVMRSTNACGRHCLGSLSGQSPRGCADWRASNSFLMRESNLATSEACSCTPLIGSRNTSGCPIFSICGFCRGAPQKVGAPYTKSVLSIAPAGFRITPPLILHGALSLKPLLMQYSQYVLYISAPTFYRVT